MSLKYFPIHQTLGFRKDLKNEKSTKIQSSSEKKLKNRKKSEHRKAIGKKFKNRNFSCQIGRSGHPADDSYEPGTFFRFFFSILYSFK